MQRIISVDERKCIHCGLCVKDCIVNCLEFNPERIPVYSQDGQEKCVACQHCFAICPTGALSFGGLYSEDSQPICFGSSEELLAMIKSRRSIRRFRNDSIPPSQLDKIIDMLGYPPIGGNRSCLHFSIVNGKEKMQEIVKVSYEKIAERRGDDKLLDFMYDCYQKGQDFIYRDAPAMIVSAIDKSKAVAGCETTDPIIALSYLDLYAYSLGLGVLWCDAALYVAERIPEVRDLLQIPEGYSLGYVLMLGVPAVQYTRTVQKKAASVTVL